MAPTPRKVAERIGREYMRQPVEPQSAFDRGLTRKAFYTMAGINDELFREIPVPVEFQEDDPYDSYQGMKESVEREGILRVFSGCDPHPIWSHQTEVVSRAVHDWYGHLHLDVPFTPVGEYRKWEHSRTHYPAFCDRVLFTEVIGQLGAALFLDDGFGDDRFEQKVFPMPQEYIEQMSRAVETV